jgi:NAD-dependent deacetylase
MPNTAHTSLVEMENYFDDFCVITQNIDGLHLRAGSRRVLELHGTMWKGCCPSDNEVVDLPTTPLESLPPYHLCGTALKPHVVQFGESLNPDILNAAFTASRHADLFFVIGTSGIVSPASQMPLAARDHGAAVIEINPEFTPLTPFMTESIRSKATEVMPALWNHLKKKSK